MVANTSEDRYHDLLLRAILSLVAAHILVIYGEEESFFQLLLSWDYWRSLLFSFIIAFILVTIVYRITVWLDRRFDWITATLSRTGLQVLTGLLLPAIIAFLLADIYFRLYHISIFQTIYLKFDYPVIVLMLLLLNVYYLAFYFFRQWQAANAMKGTALPGVARPVKRDVYMASKGSEQLPLPLTAICYFYHQGDYNFVSTFGGDNYLVSDSLDSIEQTVPDALFFRANRQIIVNHAACQKYEQLEYGKLKLIVRPSFKETIIISQKRARDFKQWLQQSEVDRASA